MFMACELTCLVAGSKWSAQAPFSGWPGPPMVWVNVAEVLVFLCLVSLHSLFSGVRNFYLPTAASALWNGRKAASVLLCPWGVLREVAFKEGSVCDSGVPLSCHALHLFTAFLLPFSFLYFELSARNCCKSNCSPKGIRLIMWPQVYVAVLWSISCHWC